MPSAATPPTAPIPAWKRLGLKLKSAQALEHTSEPPVDTDFLKRKSTNSIDHHPSKKSKKTPRDSRLPEEPITPNFARKKSVRFTPETKIEDGDSIKQDFGAWVAEQKAQDKSFQLRSNQVFDTPQPSKVEEQIDPTLNEKDRRVKRFKVKKSEEKAETPQPQGGAKQKKSISPKPSKVTKPTKAPMRPFLHYLKQYHESRDTWKFNKNHQNHLLKHAFDVNVVPSDHAHLLYEYVRGLQGGVRTRLRDQALANIVKDQEDGAAGFPETMPDRERMQREYEASKNEFVAVMTLANDASSKMGYEEGVLMGLSDFAMRDRMAKRLRSERMLREVGMPDEGKFEAEADAEEQAEISSRENGPKVSYSDDDSQKRLRMNDGSSKKVVRKRKQRTATVDDDSSSDGSSESESSSDNDSTTPPRRTARVEDSSTSSSSSSSSDSDDDDDEDDEDENDEDDEKDDGDEEESESD